MEAETPTLPCLVCYERKPLDQFRRRKKESDARHYECRDCHNLHARELRARRRREHLDDALVQLRRYRESPGQVEHLTGVLIAMFHGVAGVAVEYANAFDAAKEAGDHKTAARYLIGLMDFMYVAERERARRTIENEKRRRRREALRRQSMRDDGW